MKITIICNNDKTTTKVIRDNMHIKSEANFKKLHFL